MFNFDSMFENIEKIQPEKNKFGPDLRFWKLSRNDDDTGIARIRLLPSKVKYEGEEELVPFVRIYKYNISLRAFGAKKFTEIELPEDDNFKSPINELRQELFKNGSEEAKKVLDILKRSEKFISNIYIVQDPIKKENTGQVKLWEYGRKLKEKFDGWHKPSQEDIAMGSSPINVWHPINGADVKLVMKKTGGFYNYDDTTHYEKSSLFDDKEKLKEVLDKEYELTEWLQTDHFMTYDEQVRKLKWLFEGTKVEDILKSLGVSLYKGETKTEPKVEKTEVESTKTTESPQQTEPKVEATSSDDDLDFLDDI